VVQFFVWPWDAFSLELPDDWVVEEALQGMDFFQPETGLGGVNIRLMTPGPMNAAEIVRMAAAESTAAELHPQPLPAPLSGAYVEYESSGETCRVWALCGGKHVLVISYRCDAAAKGVEDAIVERIVRSAVIR
jgi:hypothetical protein